VVQLVPELALEEPGTSPGGSWRSWPSYTYAAMAGCYAWQVDGANFTELIVVSVR
jgi:hypothetical protein